MKNRVLKKDGMLIMIEPANSMWGRFIYKIFHHEPFEPAGNWKIPPSGPMSGANGALPWIVFERDFDKFKRSFPLLRLEKIRYHTPFMYLISGGVSFKQVFPNFFYSIFRSVDKLLPYINRQISMFTTITVKKI